MEFRRQVAIIRAWLPLLVVCALLAGAAAFAVSSVLPKTYEATTRLNVGQSLSAVNPDYNQVLVSQSLSTTYATVATTRPILDAVIAKLGLAVSSDDLLKRVRAEAAVGSTLLSVTADDGDATRAAAIANAMAAQLVAASPTIQGRQAAVQASIDSDLAATQNQITSTQTEVDTLSGLTSRTPDQDAELTTLESTLAGLRATYATLLSLSSSNASNLLTVVEPAVAPSSPVSPKPLLNTLVAALLGLMVAAGVAFGAEYFNDAIKDSDEVETTTGLSTLGTIERMKGDRGRSEIYRLASLLHPRSSAAEAYRTLRTNIEFASVDAPIRVLLVTSSVPGEGKTTTASNLAVVFAQTGRRVLLIDADLRKPGIHIVFDLQNVRGLTTMLRTDEVTVDQVAQATEQEGLRIITTGPLPPNPAELLGSQRMRTLLGRLSGAADLLVLDSPPLQAVADSAILSSIADGTLLVIDCGHSRRGPVRQGREVLAKAGASVLGAVLNRSPARARVDYADYYAGERSSDAGNAKRARLSAEESSGHSTG